MKLLSNIKFLWIVILVLIILNIAFHSYTLDKAG
jgi:hypothetical protein